MNEPVISLLCFVIAGLAVTLFIVWNDRASLQDKLKWMTDSEARWNRCHNERYTQLIEKDMEVGQLVDRLNKKDHYLIEVEQRLQASRNYAMKLRKALAKYQSFRNDIEDALEELDDVE